MSELRGFLLDARTGWRDEPPLCTGVHPAGVLRLASSSDVPRPLADPAGTFGGLADPTGAAAGADGRAYLVDTAGCRVLRFAQCAPGFVPLPCFGGRGGGARELADPRGIAVTAGGDVVIADTGNARLLVLAADGLTVRRIIAVPGWEPWDVAVDHAGRLLVADRAGGLVHVLTCAGRWLAGWDGVSVEPAAPPLQAPVALAVDRAGRVYVAEEGSAVVRVLGQDGAVLELRQTTEGLADRFDPPVFGVDGTGAIRLSAEIVPAAAGYAPTGVFVTAPLDSRRHRCVWHEVWLDAELPAGTRVTVHTLTTEETLSPAEVAALPEDRWAGGQTHGVVGSAQWNCLVLSQPGRYLWLRLTLAGGPARTPIVRGVRVRYPRTTSLRFLPGAYREEPVSAEFTERFVALFDAIRASVTVRIDALPAVLDPYASPDGSGGEPDFLAFLESWLGLADDLRLPSARRRELVARAHELYRLRGTPAGIRAHLRICTGLDAHVLEEFRLRRWLYLGTGRLGERSAVWDAEVVRRLRLDAASYLGTSRLVGSTDPLRDPFHVSAHRFRVFLPAAADPELRRLAERVLALAAPAHTEGRVVLTGARMRVGVQAFVGIDSVVGAYPTETKAGEGRLGSDTVLGPAADRPVRPGQRIGRTTRVGTGTVLD